MLCHCINSENSLKQSDHHLKDSTLSSVLMGLISRVQYRMKGCVSFDPRYMRNGYIWTNHLQQTPNFGMCSAYHILIYFSDNAYP